MSGCCFQTSGWRRHQALTDSRIPHFCCLGPADRRTCSTGSCRSPSASGKPELSPSLQRAGAFGATCWGPLPGNAGGLRHPPEACQMLRDGLGCSENSPRGVGCRGRGKGGARLRAATGRRAVVFARIICNSRAKVDSLSRCGAAMRVATHLGGTIDAEEERGGLQAACRGEAEVAGPLWDGKEVVCTQIAARR